MGNANKEYKDRLFHFLFGREERKEWTLSLYNAVRGSDYTDKESIQINTIDDVLYLGMHNDISFLIVGELNLFEQQSSFNPNMPLRMLQYISQLYAKHEKRNHLNKYSSHLLELPVPKLVVFYNGTSDKPDEITLHLRDSFPVNADPDIEVRVRMININPDHSPALLNTCRPLREYSWVVGHIRENRTLMPLEDAISRTIDEIPEDFLIRDLLIAHRAEVSDMLETEYNEEEVLKIVAEDERRRGAKQLAALIKKLTPGSDEFYEALNATPEKLEELYRKYSISEN